MNYSITKTNSPIGEFVFICSEKYLLYATLGKFNSKSFFKFRDKHLTNELNDNYTIANEVKKQLDEYFNNRRTKFTIPIKLLGSDFEKSVQYEIKKIPFGTTKSYSDLAKLIGKPKSYRAVGNATGKNPIGIIIPCHRVIKADNSIGGFTGDLRIKRYLLDFEKKLAQRNID